MPSECCYFDVEGDFQESEPLEADCTSLYEEGKAMFTIEGGCSRDADGRHLNPICLEAGDIEAAARPEVVTLWSHYGAAGPFTNSKAEPVGSDLPMKCICEFIDDNISPSDVDYYSPTVFTPPTCFSSKRLLPGIRDKALKVPCDGGFTFHPMGGKDQVMKSIGVDMSLHRKVERLEEQNAFILDIPSLHAYMNSYLERTGFRDWPNMGKFPMSFRGRDTCAEKHITPVVFPPTAFNPFYMGSGDPRYRADRAIGLCAPAGARAFFCAAKDNPLLQPVVSWNYDDGFDVAPTGRFANGTRWRPMNILQCLRLCTSSPEGTAYIGDGPIGIVV